MTYSNLWLSVTALILDSILLWVYYREKTTDLRQVRMFGRLLMNILFLNLIEMAYTIVLMTAGDIPLADQIFAWTATAAIALIPKTLLQYMYSVFYYDSTEHAANLMINFLILVNLGAIVWKGPGVICAERSIFLRPEWGTILLVIPACLFLLIGMIQGIFLSRSVSRTQLGAMRVIVLMSLVSIVSLYYFETFPVYGFLLSLIPLFAEFTLEGRGMLVDQETGLRSRHACHTSVVTRLDQKRPFRLILILLPNLGAVLSELDDSTRERVMEKIAGVMKRSTEMPVFRVREEMFAVLQDDRDEGETQELMISLRTNLGSAANTDGKKRHISVYMCVVDLPKQVKTLDDLETVAELLEEKSRHLSEGTISIEALGMAREQELRAEIHALAQALNENRLEVWYQPIRNMKTGKFDCAEALVRMKDGKGGYIRPDQFIPAAEKSGLIRRVGLVVISSVCEFLAEKERKELGIEYIEVNLSVEDAIQEWMPRELQRVMDQYHTDPASLNVEVTETASDAASELILRNMEIVHDEMNVSLSLDDFGTGYSNISRLLSMPVDIIKFDRAMLLKAFESENGRIIFERIAGMVHSIGKKIVSEGVETKEQMEFVHSLGIEYIQGFYYARPMPKDQYIAFLREEARKGA